MKINFKMWRNALKGMPRLGKEEWTHLDPVSKWLISTRAAAIVVTPISSMIAGIFAFREGRFNLGWWLLLTFGLIMAHATNNLLNDFVDYIKGVDRGNYFRDQYGPQPLELGLMSKKGLLIFAAMNGFVAMVIGLIFVFYRGGATLLLMGLGAFFLLFYTYPLKHFALGELSLLIVWGPLMVGGGFYVLTGMWNWDVVLAGMPFALGVAATLIGKHLDKLDMDKAKHIRTLPVLLGEPAARYSVLAVIFFQYGILTYLVIKGFFSPVVFIMVLALPSYFKTVLPMYLKPKPAEKPAGYSNKIWPLWFVASMFVFTRRFGWLFLLSLVLDTALHLWLL
jgi:1,4-dihydroxy-2-naphthoate octaprenyltransferase